MQHTLWQVYPIHIYFPLHSNFKAFLHIWTFSSSKRFFFFVFGKCNLIAASSLSNILRIYMVKDRKNELLVHRFARVQLNTMRKKHNSRRRWPQNSFDSSIAFDSADESSSPFSFLKMKAVYKWPVKLLRVSWPLKLIKTSYIFFGAQQDAATTRAKDDLIRRLSSLQINQLHSSNF